MIETSWVQQQQQKKKAFPKISKSDKTKQWDQTILAPPQTSPTYLYLLRKSSYSAAGAMAVTFLRMLEWHVVNFSLFVLVKSEYSVRTCLLQGGIEREKKHNYSKSC